MCQFLKCERWAACRILATTGKVELSRRGEDKYTSKPARYQIKEHEASRKFLP